MPGTTLLNGQEIEPGLSADRAFHFGDGLFETLAVVEGLPCLWKQHIRRLRHGCERLDMNLPDPEKLLEDAKRLTRDCSKGVLKLIVSAGPATQGYAREKSGGLTCWMQISSWPTAPHYQEPLPLTLQWCELRLAEQPRLAGLKHLNRLEQVLARSELSDLVQEGLVCDHSGHVVEGVAANLLLKLEGRYVTPAISRCGIAGIVRRLILDEAARQDIDIEVTSVTTAQVEKAERLFLTSSLLGIRPVRQLGKHQYAHTGLGDDFLERLNSACFTFEGAA